ncbi:MAG: hypothetical protein OXE40_15510, partial [Gammaproteobacteria bacterium]|nr:hypothetical protein [Gammaproteobacteria bacterium]
PSPAPTPPPRPPTPPSSAYPPPRRSAEPLVSTHAETGVAMLPHMPNAPENAKLSLRSDWLWWADNGEDMNERFSAWLLR